MSSWEDKIMSCWEDPMKLFLNHAYSWVDSLDTIAVSKILDWKPVDDTMDIKDLIKCIVNGYEITKKDFLERLKKYDVSLMFSPLYVQTKIQDGEFGFHEDHFEMTLYRFSKGDPSTTYSLYIIKYEFGGLISDIECEFEYLRCAHDVYDTVMDDYVKKWDIVGFEYPNKFPVSPVFEVIDGVLPEHVIPLFSALNTALVNLYEEDFSELTKDPESYQGLWSLPRAVPVDAGAGAGSFPS